MDNKQRVMDNASRLFGEGNSHFIFREQNRFQFTSTKMSLLEKKNLFAMFVVNNDHRSLEAHCSQSLNFVPSQSNEIRKQLVIQIFSLQRYGWSFLSILLILKTK